VSEKYLRFRAAVPHPPGQKLRDPLPVTLLIFNQPQDPQPLTLNLSISHSHLTLDEREQNELMLLLLLPVLMVIMDGWVVGFAGHFGGSFLKIS
jgi:hypothetical protein